MKNRFQIIIILIAVLNGQTSNQIQQAKKIIKAKGMSESQAIEAAKASGFSDDQIKSAIDKEKKSIRGSSNPPISDIEKSKILEIDNSNVLKPVETLGSESLNSDQDLSPIDQDDLEIIDEYELAIDSKSQKDKTILEYFGYDIFKRDPTLFQSTSVGVVDPDYLIGPGDEIIVMLWGETQFRQVLSVDREGFVFVPEIGQVFVNGLNLNLLESKLFKVFSQSYASLNPQGRTPTTFLDVSLGNLRPLRIQVLGEVAQPGAYTVSPSATLFSALYYFNGPTTLGSLRDIHLIRGGRKIASIDFYDYLLKGETPLDQKLQLDDIIFIPKRLKTIKIEGEVNRSGIYELKNEETLEDIISIAGGLKVTAYLKRSQIDRIVPFGERNKLGMDRMYSDVNLEKVLNSNEGYPLQDGDHIQIFSILDLRRNVVEIRGSVTRPGSYDLGDTLSISQLINKADGLLGDAYMNRVDIIRTLPDFTEKLIKLDLKKVLEDNSQTDIILQALDKVKIYGITEMIPKTYVSILGHVKNPGRYLLRKNMTLYDLIFKAGGYIDDEYKKLTFLDRAELIRFKSETNDKEIITFNLDRVINQNGMADLALLPDDQVKIYSKEEIEGATRYVSISGHVKRPGRYELFEENMRIKDLLFRSGGFDDPIYKSRTFLERLDVIRYDNDRIAQFLISLNLESILSEKNSKDNILLLPGDEIRVYPETVFNSVHSVTISGVVRKPGNYKLKQKMVLKDLILEAGGLKENVYRYRVEVARIDPLNQELEQYADVITFYIDEKYSLFKPYQVDNLSNSSYEIGMFKLEPYDIISIKPDPFFNIQKQVSIVGEVLYPGDYVILKSDENITDIIKRAGGLRPNAYLPSSLYKRNGDEIKVAFEKILKNPKSALNFNVQHNDQIIINSQPNVVRVIGEVNTEGIHKFVQGKRLKYYLKNCGGLSPDADRQNIWVEYPNGDSKKYRRGSLYSPKIIDGSVIVVSKKKEKEFDKTQYAKDITSILANLAQAVTIIFLAAR